MSDFTPELVALIGKFELFDSRKPVSSNMRFDAQVGDIRYRCSITPTTRKFIAPGKADICKVVFAVSSVKKLLDGLQNTDEVLIKYGPLEVGTMSEFEI